MLTCGEADHPARQTPSPGLEIGPFQQWDGGSPVCLAAVVANPITVAGQGEARGSVFSSLPAFPQDEGNRPVRRRVGPHVRPPPRTRPGMSGRDLRGRAGGTASIRPLSCAEDSSRAVGTGGGGCPNPSPRQHKGRPRASLAVGGMEDGTPILALLSHPMLLCVVESLRGGRRCPSVSAPVSGGKWGCGPMRVRDPCPAMFPAQARETAGRDPAGRTPLHPSAPPLTNSLSPTPRQGPPGR